MQALKIISQQDGDINHQVLAEQIVKKIEGYLNESDNNEVLTIKISHKTDDGVQIQAVIKSACNEKEANESELSGTPKLTRREKDVIQLIAKGLSYNEIAQVLIMSTHTVTTHIKNIYKKLSVHSRGEAAFEAMQLGLLS